MIKILIGIAAFALATTGQVSLAGTSQVSYSSAPNHIILAHNGSRSYEGKHDSWEKDSGNGTCHKHEKNIHNDYWNKSDNIFKKCRKT